nr:hypothetical protein [Fluviicola taffensis]
MGFGSVVLILSYAEFIRFSEQVHSIHTMHYEEEEAKLLKNENLSNKDEKPKEKIYMHTDNSKMILAFNHKEWMKLYDLLEESRFLLYANEFIEQS